MKLLRAHSTRLARAAGLGLLALPVVLGAEPYIYTGNNTPESPASGNWNNDQNWSDYLAPGAWSFDTELIFGGSGSAAYTATNDYGAFNLNRLALASTSSALVTLAGGTLNFGADSLSAGPRLTQDGSGAATISSAIALGDALTIDGTGTGLLSLTGTITGTGSLTLDNAAGTLLLSGASTYSGGTTLSAGTLQVGRNTTGSITNGPLGTGALTLSGGRLSSDGATGRTLANAVTIAGDVSLGDLVNNGALTLTGPVTLSAANATLATDSTVQINGAIGGGTNGFTKSGSGLLTLTNAGNSYTGLTTVADGTLRLSAAGAAKGDVLVTGPGILSTTTANAIANTSGVTVANGGTWALSPGGNQAVRTLAIGSASDDAGGSSLVQLGTTGGNAPTLQITGSGADVFRLEGSETTPAIFSFGGNGLTTGTVQFTSSSPGTGTTIHLGAHGRLVSGGTPAGSGSGGLYTTSATSASNYFTFNFEGTTLSTQDYTGAESGPGSLYYNVVRVGDSSSQTAGYFNRVNFNASLGDGTGYLQVVKSAINLGWTGSLNLGALVTARDSASGNPTNTTAATGNSAPITVRNTATGMTGGVIYGAGNLTNGPGTSTGFTALTFEAADTPHTFTLGTDDSGDNPVNNVATIDVRVRNTAAGAGVITQNNVSLLIDGGILRGNALAAASAGLTLRGGGELTLANDTAAYAISTTGTGADNRTIFMDGPGAGTFTLGGSGTSVITIDTQTGSGTWSGGILNANGGHTINDGSGGISGTTAAGFFTGYAIADRSGLNGIAMNNAAPFATTAAGVAPAVRMTLGEGSSFFAKNSATASGPVTYYIGEASTLAALAPATVNNVGIATAATGSFMFGFNQANGTQATLGASAIAYSGDNTAAIALPADPATYGLSVGGVLTISGASGAGNSYFNGTFVITGIDGNTVTFALNALPPDGTAAPATGSANIRRTQTLVLLRDKGDAGISLLANTLGGAVRISSDQTGSGNLYANAGSITLDTGASFSGTGGIYSGNTVVGSGWTNLGGNTVIGDGAYGTLNGSAGTQTLLVVNGALGTSSSDNIAVSLNRYLGTSANGGNSGIVIGGTATLAGTQDWTVAGSTSGWRNAPLFANHLTDASAWNASVSLTTQGQFGLIEASTRADTPSAGSHYKFSSVALAGAGTQHIGIIKLVNNVQNDGGSGKEALYAGHFSATATDSSGGTVLVNLNGQDLWFDSFTPVTGKAVSLVNDAAGTTSAVRYLGDPASRSSLMLGAFRVLNGATLETNAGWYSMGWERNVGNIVADTAAAPNGAAGDNVRATLAADGTAGNAASFTSFLGSGADTGGNTHTTAAGTDGTFRVLHGKFQAGNYILNPVGANGLIDTTGEGDTTLDDVIIRTNAAQAVALSNGSTWLTLGERQLYSVGDIVQFGGTVAGFTQNTRYYVVGVDGDRVQVSTEPGGTALSATGNGSGILQDPNGAGAGGGLDATPALVVAGNTRIVGNLVLAHAPGAVHQATLRVGGVEPSTTDVPAVAHASTATLEVVGGLTIGETNNLALQSNAIVKVGGDVDIRGVGANVVVTVGGKTARVTGTGVGIHADSHFTLNGNSGASAPQTVSIVPAVGRFHVGDGSGGVLAGTAAQALLSANLTSASGIDINGAASRLNLGGFTLAANGSGLVVGGAVTGTGTVSGETRILSGGSLHAADTVGVLAFSDAVTLEAGSAIHIAINGAASRGTDYSGVTFNGGLTIEGGSLLFDFGSTIANGSVLDLFDGVTLTSTFTSVVASGSYSGAFLLNEGGTAYNGVFGAQEITFTLSSGELSFAASAIPEPATTAALAAAFALALTTLRHRRR